MERLTDKNIDYEQEFCRDCPYYGEPNGCNREKGECDAYSKFTSFAKRLVELEDKSEHGKVLELPCGPDDTVYYVTEADDGENIFYIILVGVVDCFNIAADCKEVLVRYEGGLTYWHTFNDFGKCVFVDKILANNKLGELQN